VREPVRLVRLVETGDRRGRPLFLTIRYCGMSGLFNRNHALISMLHHDLGLSMSQSMSQLMSQWGSLSQQVSQSVSQRVSQSEWDLPWWRVVEAAWVATVRSGGLPTPYPPQSYCCLPCYPIHWHLLDMVQIGFVVWRSARFEIWIGQLTGYMHKCVKICINLIQ